MYGRAGRLLVAAFQGDSTDGVIDPGKMGRRVNVRYVLEGNVLRSGETSTVSLQLVDAVSGAQVWSERATVQDSDVLTKSSPSLRHLAVRVRIALINAEVRRVLAQPESELSAQELVLRALANPAGQVRSLASVREARRLVDHALELDASSVPALLVRTDLADDEIGLNLKADSSRLVQEMDKDTARAVELDRTNPSVWIERAPALLRLGRWDAALEAVDTAIKLDPDDPAKLIARAQFMNTIGRPAEALALSDRAMANDKEGVQPLWCQRASHICCSDKLTRQLQFAKKRRHLVTRGLRSHCWLLRTPTMAITQRRPSPSPNCYGSYPGTRSPKHEPTISRRIPSTRSWRRSITMKGCARLGFPKTDMASVVKRAQQFLVPKAS